MTTPARAYRLQVETLHLIESIGKQEFVDKTEAISMAVRHYVDCRSVQCNTQLFKEFLI